MSENLENLKNNSKWGGSREGAGRPKGSKNEETLERERVQAEMRRRIMKSTDELLNSQMSLAKGVQMLYRIDKDENGKNKKPELVTSQAEIENYFAGDYDEQSEYYFITTERPDNKAIDSLFDRTFGKAQQHVDVKSDGKPIFQITSEVANKYGINQSANSSSTVE